MRDGLEFPTITSHLQGHHAKSTKGNQTASEMLQGLRRKIGRYAPRGGGKDTPDEEHGELGETATPMEAAVWRFTRQDKALRAVETHLTLMLDQLQVACATMATVAELFAESCSDGETHGEDFKAATKEIEVQEAERLEQSIRFTVLDPLQARLERHNQLKYQLDEWEKRAAEFKVQRALLLKLQSSGLEDDEKRKQTEVDLHRVAAALQEIEANLLPQLENDLQSSATRTVNLFSTMRLQTAIFFRNANQTVLSSLSPLEKEIVAEANPPLKFSTVLRNSLALSAPRLTMSSVASDGWTEVDGSSSSIAPDGVETISGSDEDDESANYLVTIDDFESGRVAPLMYKHEDDAALRQLRAKYTDPTRFMSLASYPVVVHDDSDQEIRDGELSKPLCHSTSPSTRSTRLMPSTSRKTVSMLSSIGKTIRGKLSYSSGETRPLRQSSAPTMNSSSVGRQHALTLPRLCPKELDQISRLPIEWLAIEECLWEIDVRVAKSPGKSLLPAHSISSNTDDILYRLLQKDDTLYFNCLSFLRVEDLARLSKVNFRLHSHLVDNAPIWKKCIRSGGVSPAIRSSLWLSVFYESTPWRSSAIASHYLSADRRCSMYHELLTKVGTKVDGGLLADEESVVDDDAQLAVWFREIDVDVVRTCHRNAEAENTKAMDQFTSGASTLDGDNSVACILDEMVSTIVKVEDNCVGLAGDVVSQRMNTSRSDLIGLDLEAKMRRVLRAYVVYNPRVGYCQGMSFLVRLLVDVAHDEADIFWLFVGFSEPENDRNLYEPGMAVLQPYLSKFQILFSTHMPELFTHFESEGVHVATFCTRWFLTFFSTFETLAPPLVTRLLDIFIIDGWRIMFSISLVILEELQEELLKCDMEGILRVFKSPRDYMPEPDCIRQRQLVRHALAFSTSRTLNSV